MALDKLRNRVSVSTQEAVAEVFNKLDEQNCDPISELAKIAMGPLTPLSDKISILKELAQYIAPKRKSVDVTTPSDNNFVVTIKNFSNDPKQVTGLINSDVDPRTLLKTVNGS